MFMRLLQSKLKPGTEDLLRRFYETRIIPEFQKMPGCLFAGLILGKHHPETGISMTLWRTKEDAETYEKSDISKDLLKEAAPYLSESSEWKVRLSEDLELTYGPVPEEPMITSYPVKAQKPVESPPRAEVSQLHTRIVSHKVRKEKIEAFNDIYTREIIPALQAVDGCLYAYLLESMQKKGQGEMLSVTIWENREKAEHYEKSGRFAQLVEKLKHTFTQLSQWRMSLEKEEGKQAKTSDDMSVSHYSMVTGKHFK